MLIIGAPTVRSDQTTSHCPSPHSLEAKAGFSRFPKTHTQSLKPLAFTVTEISCEYRLSKLSRGANAIFGGKSDLRKISWSKMVWVCMFCCACVGRIQSRGKSTGAPTCPLHPCLPHKSEVVFNFSLTFFSFLVMHAKVLPGSVLSSANWITLCKWSWLTLVSKFQVDLDLTKCKTRRFLLSKKKNLCHFVPEILRINYLLALWIAICGWLVGWLVGPEVEFQISVHVKHRGHLMSALPLIISIGF